MATPAGLSLSDITSSREDGSGMTSPILDQTLDMKGQRLLTGIVQADAGGDDARKVREGYAEVAIRFLVEQSM